MDLSKIVIDYPVNSWLLPFSSFSQKFTQFLKYVFINVTHGYTNLTFSKPKRKSLIFIK